MNRPYLSIVSPIYNAEKIAVRLVKEITRVAQDITDDYEIILVEDGSPDKSWKVLQEISAANPKVRSIKLSKNFGQHYAITAGLDFAEGEWTVVMDCDLQDRPEEIPRMLAYAKEKDAKIVLGQRKLRNDSKLKVSMSKLFYGVLSYLSGSRWDPTVANFGLYHRDVVSAIKTLREPIRFFPSMVKWVGFHCVKMEVKHQARDEGKSNYNLKKRLKLALDIILANSDKPLRIIVKAGFLISFISSLIGLFYLIKYFSGGIRVMGYTSLMISIWLISGMTFVVLGIIGLYIGKIFESVKHRPIYIVEEKINV